MLNGASLMEEGKWLRKHQLSYLELQGTGLRMATPFSKLILALAVIAALLAVTLFDWPVGIRPAWGEAEPDTATGADVDNKGVRPALKILGEPTADFSVVEPHCEAYIGSRLKRYSTIRTHAWHVWANVTAIRCIVKRCMLASLKFAADSLAGRT